MRALWARAFGAGPWRCFSKAQSKQSDSFEAFELSVTIPLHCLQSGGGRGKNGKVTTIVSLTRFLNLKMIHKKLLGI